MILKTMDGVVIRITAEEAQTIAKAKQSKERDVIVRGAMIPCSSIALYPDEFWGERAKQGRLHDGTQVVQQFGRWVDARDPKLQLSPDYYPEIAKDQVMSEFDWEKGNLKELVEPERSLTYDRMMQVKVSMAGGVTGAIEDRTDKSF